MGLLPPKDSDEDFSVQLEYTIIDSSTTQTSDPVVVTAQLDLEIYGDVDLFTRFETTDDVLVSDGGAIDLTGTVKFLKMISMVVKNYATSTLPCLRAMIGM